MGSQQPPLCNIKRSLDVFAQFYDLLELRCRSEWQFSNEKVDVWTEEGCLCFLFSLGTFGVHLYITACLKGPNICYMHLSLHMGHIQGAFWMAYCLLSPMGNSFIIEQRQLPFLYMNSKTGSRAHHRESIISDFQSCRCN